MAGLGGAAGPAPRTLTAAAGLTRAEAARRRAARPPRRPPGSRGYGEIVRANLLTVFTAVLGTLLVLALVFGEPQDALFGGVIIVNTAIGIVQEIRAKRVLDRLALVVAPRARVVRDGEEERLPVPEVVPGDLVRLRPGDQVVADGALVASRALALDESVLTGESDRVPRAAGEPVLSGAYCVEGAGEYVVERVGEESFAGRLAAEARSTRPVRSPLERDIDRILRFIAVAMAPLAALLLATIALRGDDLPLAAERTVAALVPLVPEGLVLLTSLTFAIAGVRMGRLGALAQRLNAVEALAGADTVCVDKTGTLTENRLRVVALEPADGDAAALRRDLGVLAASSGAANATLQAVAEAAPGSARAVSSEVPFSSERKWSGVTLEGGPTLVLGAPEVLAAHGVDLTGPTGDAVRRHQDARRRVVVLARGDAPLDCPDRPPRLTVAGIVAMEEGVRPDAAPTVAFLRDQGIDVKVISGDGVATVQAVARQVGVEGADRAVAGPDLPSDPEALAAVARDHAVFGRVTPHQKRDLVRALQRGGRNVAMIGDGVNDVPALREARLAVAMGNGSEMAKGVAGIVLMTSSFAVLPSVIAEGRRLLASARRVAKLFVAKTVYAALLLVTLGLTSVAFPFLPRHLTVTSSLTIGIPAFVLALTAPVPGPHAPRFLPALLAFTVPAGAAAAAAIAGAYGIVRGVLDLGVTQGRTAAVLTATAMGLAIVVQVERGPERARPRPFVIAMVAAFAVALLAGLRIFPLRDFFAVSWPTGGMWAASAGCAVGGVALMAALRALPLARDVEAGRRPPPRWPPRRPPAP